MRSTVLGSRDSFCCPRDSCVHSTRGGHASPGGAAKSLLRPRLVFVPGLRSHGETLHDRNGTAGFDPVETRSESGDFRRWTCAGRAGDAGVGEALAFGRQGSSDTMSSSPAWRRDLVRRRCILPEVVLGMVRSLMATCAGFPGSEGITCSASDRDRATESFLVENAARGRTRPSGLAKARRRRRTPPHVHRGEARRACSRGGFHPGRTNLFEGCPGAVTAADGCARGGPWIGCGSRSMASSSCILQVPKGTVLRRAHRRLPRAGFTRWCVPDGLETTPHRFSSRIGDDGADGYNIRNRGIPSPIALDRGDKLRSRQLARRTTRTRK